MLISGNNRQFPRKANSWFFTAAAFFSEQPPVYSEKPAVSGNSGRFLGTASDFWEQPPVSWNSCWFLGTTVGFREQQPVSSDQPPVSGNNLQKLKRLCDANGSWSLVPGSWFLVVSGSWLPPVSGSTRRFLEATAGFWEHAPISGSKRRFLGTAAGFWEHAPVSRTPGFWGHLGITRPFFETTAGFWEQPPVSLETAN